jgi:hypothetical protein
VRAQLALQDASVARSNDCDGVVAVGVCTRAMRDDIRRNASGARTYVRATLAKMDATERVLGDGRCGLLKRVLRTMP